VRHNLQIFLREFGDALIKYRGANGLREFYATSAGAEKNTALVNQALLGTEPHDLSGLVKNLDSTVRALDADETGLQDLVTNARTVTGSFAAHSQALETAIGELPRTLAAGRPALLHLDEAFPPLLHFAREALPGVRSTPETLDVATPFLHQLQGLVSERELRGLVHDLRPTIPRLTKLAKRTIPFLHQSRALSSCFNEVIVPWSNKTVPNSTPPSGDPSFPSPGKVYQETGYGLAGISGESRSGDANGQYIRVAAGGGTNNVVYPPGSYGFPDLQAGVVPFPPIGALPAISSSAKTPFRPGVRCEKQHPPNLNPGSMASPPSSSAVSASSSATPGPVKTLMSRDRSYLERLGQAMRLRDEGKLGQANAQIERAQRSFRQFQSHGLKSIESQLRSLGGSR
jgi:hypothetical protein